MQAVLSPAPSLRRKRSSLRPLPQGPRHILRASGRQLPSPLQSPSGASEKFVSLPAALRRSSPLHSLISMSSAEATIRSLVCANEKQGLPVSPPPTADCVHSPPPISACMLPPPPMADCEQLSAPTLGCPLPSPPMEEYLQVPPPSGQMIVSPLPKSAKLDPPPVISFEPRPIHWKGLTLQAAQASLTSSELQTIVSRAIRTSAQPSAIRLVPIEVLDATRVESRRLNERKAAIQAKYRFHVQRRSALLQTISTFHTSSQDKAEAARTLAALTSQLSHTMAACDLLIEEMLHIADQQMQISKLEDVHFSSALSIALRKLNRGYERKCNEASKAQNKVRELEAQLEEMRGGGQQPSEPREPVAAPKVQDEVRQLEAQREEMPHEERHPSEPSVSKQALDIEEMLERMRTAALKRAEVGESHRRAPVRPLPTVPDPPALRDSPILKRVSVTQPAVLRRSRSVQSNRSTRSRRSSRISRSSSFLKRRKRALAVSDGSPSHLHGLQMPPFSPAVQGMHRRPRATGIVEEPRAVSFLDLDQKEEQMLMSRWLGLKPQSSTENIRRWQRRGQENDQRSIKRSRFRFRVSRFSTLAELRKLKTRIFRRRSDAFPKYI